MQCKIDSKLLSSTLGNFTPVEASVQKIANRRMYTDELWDCSEKGKDGLVQWVVIGGIIEYKPWNAVE